MWVLLICLINWVRFCQGIGYGCVLIWGLVMDIVKKLILVVKIVSMVFGILICLLYWMWYNVIICSWLVFICILVLVLIMFIWNRCVVLWCVRLLNLVRIYRLFLWVVGFLFFINRVKRWLILNIIMVCGMLCVSKLFVIWVILWNWKLNWVVFW